MKNHERRGSLLELYIIKPFRTQDDRLDEKAEEEDVEDDELEADDDAMEESYAQKKFSSVETPCVFSHTQGDGVKMQRLQGNARGQPVRGFEFARPFEDVISMDGDAGTLRFEFLLDSEQMLATADCIEHAKKLWALPPGRHYDPEATGHQPPATPPR